MTEVRRSGHAGRRDERRRAERGSATVWLLAAMGVVTAAALAMGLLAAGEVVRRRAAAAADAAALAGAEAVDAGDGSVCATAAAFARADGARLSRCAVAGTVVSVTVETDLPGPLRLTGPISARAAAGPASATPGQPPGTPR